MLFRHDAHHTASRAPGSKYGLRLMHVIVGLSEGLSDTIEMSCVTPRIVVLLVARRCTKSENCEGLSDGGEWMGRFRLLPLSALAGRVCWLLLHKPNATLQPPGSELDVSEQ